MEVFVVSLLSLVGQYCTTDEGDRVVENFGCVIIVTIKFVDQDIIEFFSRFSYTYIYTFIHHNSLRIEIERTCRNIVQLE